MQRREPMLIVIADEGKNQQNYNNNNYNGKYLKDRQLDSYVDRWQVDDVDDGR